MTTRFVLCGLALAAFAAPAAADFERISRERDFLQLVQGRDLTRMGIRLTVTPQGQITGSAFGKDVTGAWKWRDGYFCRDLAWGERDFGYNCQTVDRDGGALRFTSDRGTGQSADLYLK